MYLYMLFSESFTGDVTVVERNPDATRNGHIQNGRVPLPKPANDEGTEITVYGKGLTVCCAATTGRLVGPAQETVVTTAPATDLFAEERIAVERRRLRGGDLGWYTYSNI